MITNRFLDTFKMLVGVLGVSSAVSSSGQGFVNSGITFSDYVFIEVAPGSNFKLATTGDIYVWVPAANLYSASLDLRAASAFVNVPLWADNYVNFNIAPKLTPTFFQDVVLRVSAPVGRMQLDAEGSMVFDAIAVPVPEPALLWALAPAALFVAWRKRKSMI